MANLSELRVGLYLCTFDTRFQISPLILSRLYNCIMYTDLSQNFFFFFFFFFFLNFFVGPRPSLWSH